MDHQVASDTRAAERYVLGEMPADERDRFEEHFFECQSCADDVRVLTVFIANSRAVLGKETTSKSETAAGRDWFAWLRPAWAVPAMAGLALALIWESFILVPGLRSRLAAAEAPRQTFATVLLAETRGEPKQVSQQPSAPLQLMFDLNTDQSYQSYVAEIRTESGSSLLKIPFRPPATAEPVFLSIPSPRLAPGRYVLIVHGQSSTLDQLSGPEVGLYRFEVNPS